MIGFTEIHKGLEIARGVYKDEALQIAAEVAQIDDVLWPDRGYDGFYGLIPPTGMEIRSADADDEAKERVRRVHANLGALAHDITGYENRVSVNKYLPKKSGRWHDDYRPLLPVYVLGLVDIEKPSFEYAPVAVRKNSEWRPVDEVFGVSISVGDILRVSNSIVHRGTNPTEDVRYTGLMYQ